MGRELRRVPLDFSWPINTVWQGFINPLHVATKCSACDGSGYSPAAKRLHDRWYGYVPFRPEDRDSKPFCHTDWHVWSFAARNVSRSPEYYGGDARAVDAEARRLTALWNRSWSHHLNVDDVAALVDAGRLCDFTHTFTSGIGWQLKEPAYHPTPEEVNVWSCGGMGHDSINAWVCIKAECDRLGEPRECAQCGGDGEIWPSAEAKQAYEDWQQTEPPTGDGYQIWETVSEGGPISPPFSTPEDLARHMATTKWGADKGTSYETWLAFIRGPGWAPSMVGTDQGLVSGAEDMVASVNTP
ncbi:hypothetical protein LB523_12345 [Mesorhizobium sp. ESP-6-4]|uniref:hypothetical protein n=1 Tax=Mesorhizobium sp. ESP-6-4 TaxID=2876624 RepID=UPI001CCEB517|nr:hypothetical protein [Mesorhizobium sp. ESP-6-4]MBZ9659837.1 hypothetical protein [Mesorhizobium sp. ESP-6-4]